VLYPQNGYRIVIIDYVTSYVFYVAADDTSLVTFEAGLESVMPYFRRFLPDQLSQHLAIRSAQLFRVGRTTSCRDDRDVTVCFQFGSRAAKRALRVAELTR